jgi:peptide/nickel transport system substrate-binding protein
MADAGYPQGFGVTLDCPNDRYINDEAICQAVVGMMAQIGIKVNLNAQTRTTYFPKIQNRDTSFYLLGWGVPTYDALYSLASLLATTDGSANGQWNYTGYSNPRMDDLIKAVNAEFDPGRRTALSHEALRLAQQDLPYIPLHHQVLVWTTKQNVNVPLAADNRPRFRYATVN